MHACWLPLVCARFSLIPVMLGGLVSVYWQDLVGSSLFALAGFGAWMHILSNGKCMYLVQTVFIMHILHSKHTAPLGSWGPLWTCASAVDSCKQKWHFMWLPHLHSAHLILDGACSSHSWPPSHQHQLPSVLGPAIHMGFALLLFPGLQPGAPSSCSIPAANWGLERGTL